MHCSRTTPCRVPAKFLSEARLLVSVAGRRVIDVKVGGRAVTTARNTTEEVRALAEQRSDRFAELEEYYAGYEVYDRNGEKIGNVDDIFVDKSDDPEYIGVKMGFLGTKSTLIPMDAIRIDERRRIVEVSWPKSKVKEGPAFDDDKEVTPEYEEWVRSFYGLGSLEGSADKGTYGDSNDRKRSYAGRGEGSERQPSATVGDAGRKHSSGLADELRMQRTEEELRVGIREREAGRVNIRKRVRTDRERIRVPRRREEVKVERMPVEGRRAPKAEIESMPVKGQKAPKTEIGEDKSSVTVTEEEIVVERRPVVKEEIRLRKDVVEDEEVVEKDVRKEEIDIDDQTERRGALRRVRIKDEKVPHPPQGAGNKTSPEEGRELDRYTHRKEQSSEKGQQQRTANTKAAKGGQKGLPIEGYDDLTVEEAKKKLGGLSVGELKEIRSYEKKHKSRKTLVEWLDRKIKDAS